MKIEGKKLKVVVSGRVDPDLARDFKKGVRKWRMTKSEAVEAALRMYWDNHLAWNPIELKKKQK